MQRVGRTRLPPASMEYLMASSSPLSRDSRVNLRPRKYSSKTRLCVSHLSWLLIPLAPLAMPHLAARPKPRAPQHPPHERRRLFAGEPRGELDGLVYRHVGRDVIHVEHLVEGEAQNGAVHRAHAVHGPPDGDLREHGIELLLLLLDAAREPESVLFQFAPVLPPAGYGGVERALVDVALEKVEERVLAGRPATHEASRVRYVSASGAG